MAFDPAAVRAAESSRRTGVAYNSIVMRIFLACTVRGERGPVLAGRAICARLQCHGHEVLTTVDAHSEVISCARRELTSAMSRLTCARGYNRCDDSRESLVTAP